MNPNFLMSGEWRAVLEMQQLFQDPVYRGVGVLHGDAKPLVVIPGFMAGDWSLAPLTRWLQRVGYRPALTGIELNTRCPRALAEGLRNPVARLARTIAHARPDLVSHVIAIGTPYRDALDANWYVRSLVRGEPLSPSAAGV
jgi:triacylglycerol lipase